MIQHILLIFLLLSISFLLEAQNKLKWTQMEKGIWKAKIGNPDTMSFS